jgi:hypothetical protein
MAEIHQIEATFDSLDLLGKGELLGLRDGFLKLRDQNVEAGRVGVADFFATLVGVFDQERHRLAVEWGRLEWAAAGVEAEDLGDDEWTSSLELPPET